MNINKKMGLPKAPKPLEPHGGKLGDGAIIYYVDERNWGYATAINRKAIIKAIAEKFNRHEEIAERILEAYLDNLRGESTVFQKEMLEHNKDIVDFLDTITKEVDEETAKEYFFIE